MLQKKKKKNLTQNDIFSRIRGHQFEHTAGFWFPPEVGLFKPKFTSTELLQYIILIILDRKFMKTNLCSKEPKYRDINL